MNWTGVIANELAEEEEMSSLAARFSTWMRKRVAGSEGETTLSSDGKRMKQYSLDEEAHKDWEWTLLIEPPMISRSWKVPLMRPMHLWRRGS